MVKYKSKEKQISKESTTLGKIAKGAAIAGGIALAIALLSGSSDKNG